MKLITKSCKIADFPTEDLITNIYLKPQFLQLLTTHFGYNINYLYVKNTQHEQIVAVTILIEKKRLGIPYLIKPQILYYQPIEIFINKRKRANENQLQELEIFQEISAYLTKYFFQINMNLPPEISDIRGFTWSGLKAKPFYTYRFMLNDYDSANFFKSQRGSLRRAMKLNYSFNQDSNIDRYFELAKATKIRQQWDFKINDEKLANFITDLVKLGFVKQFNICTPERSVVSTMFCLLDQTNRTAYGWLTTTAIEEFSNGVSTLLFHSICEQLKEEYDIFDLCGANTDSIARFKASMGAELQVFYNIQL